MVRSLTRGAVKGTPLEVSINNPFFWYAHRRYMAPCDRTADCKTARTLYANTATPNATNAARRVLHLLQQSFLV
jgi:hypothetical protein